jgi:hypothetical protein
MILYSLPQISLQSRDKQDFHIPYLSIISPTNRPLPCTAVGHLEFPTNTAGSTHRGERERARLPLYAPWGIGCCCCHLRSIFKGILHILADANSSTTPHSLPFLSTRFTRSHQAPPSTTDKIFRFLSCWSVPDLVFLLATEPSILTGCSLHSDLQPTSNPQSPVSAVLDLMK